jgi:hypothetical protein
MSWLVSDFLDFENKLPINEKIELFGAATFLSIVVSFKFIEESKERLID